MTTTLSRLRPPDLYQITLCLLAAWTWPIVAQEPSGTTADQAEQKTKTEPSEKAAESLPPLPADAHTEQTIQLDGKPLKYTADRRHPPALLGRRQQEDRRGRLHRLHVMDGAGIVPVTFAFNGGPGAASVYLDFGAIGPKRLAFGDQGDSPSNPATLTDNPGPGSTSPIWCFSIRLAPASAGRSSPPTPKRDFFAPTTTSTICRARSSTGWSRTSA